MVFRKFNYSEELSAQRALFLECFPENSGSPAIENEHYLWKFHGSDEVPHSYEYCASIEKELIGYYAAINYPYKYFGRNISAGMVCEVMTGIKARGQGIFTKLGAYAIGDLSHQEIAFITGYPIRKEVLPGHRKTGWHFPFQIPMYGKFLSVKSFLRSRTKAWAIPFLNPLLLLFNFLTDITRRRSDSVRFERILISDLENVAGFEDFLKELETQTNITLRKNTRFLKWRLGAPGKSYSLVMMKVNSKIAGYAVGRFAIKEKVPCFGVLDIAILNGFEKYSSLLLKELEEIAEEQEAELILIMIMKKFASNFRFFKNGWIRTPFKFSFIVKQIDKTISETDLLREENWSLTWLDSDDL